LASLFLISVTVAARGDGLEELQAIKSQFNQLHNAGRYREAEPVARQLLEAARNWFPNEPTVIAMALNNLAITYNNLDRFEEAEKLHLEALRLRNQSGQATLIAESLGNLAVLYNDQGRYNESTAMHHKQLKLLEDALGPQHADVANALNNFGETLRGQAKYEEAMRYYARARAIFERNNDSRAGTVVSNAGLARDAQGKLAEAEQLTREALAIAEKAQPRNDFRVAVSMNNLAAMLASQNRIDEAIAWQQQSLAIQSRLFGKTHSSVASGLHNLGSMYADLDRLSDAESAFRQSLETKLRVYGADHEQVAVTSRQLANVVKEFGRLDEAAELIERACEIEQEQLGEDHPRLAISLNDLALVYSDQGEPEEAVKALLRSLAIAHKHFGDEHPEVARTLGNLGSMYSELDEPEKARQYGLEALKLNEAISGADSLEVLTSVQNLGHLEWKLDRSEQALFYVERARQICERNDASPDERFSVYHLRAQVLRDLGRKQDALTALEVALKLAEESRNMGAADESDRAGIFSKKNFAFARMVAWQAERGDLTAAWQAAERGTARSLLDQLASAGVDPLVGLSANRAAELRNRDRLAKRELAGLERQWEVVAEDTSLKEDARQLKLEELADQLETARKAVSNIYREIRNASLATQLQKSDVAKLPGPAEIGAWLAAHPGLWLQYYVSDDQVFLFAMSHPDNAKLHLLQVTEDDKQVLGLEEGELTRGDLVQLLTDGQDALLAQLRKPSKDPKLTERLSQLYKLLIPEEYRAALVSGKYPQLVVIPQGSLAMLPFETLVVEATPEPRYLLDAGPPILTSPSAAILLGLTARTAATTAKAANPVFSVGNPVYGGSGESAPSRVANSRHGSWRGRLPPLPYSGLESSWVVEVFGKRGIRADKLIEIQATEAAVRRNVTGRQIIHLACHGLADQQHGNLFGALALTTGRDGNDPADDGMLTLAEIYSLQANACDLAILSACDTNVGPEQDGEGVWALSRGFLVAGAKRVTATNWIVDDQAAATLISYFSATVADGISKRNVNFAAALQQAKRNVRQQEKWSHPYYWGSFVLIGPP